MSNSEDLKKKIDEFKGKMTLKSDYMVFEPNSFDIFLDKLVLKINHRVNDLNNNKMIKKILSSSLFVFKRTILNFWNSLKNITEKLNLIKIKFDQLEKKIEHQEIIINENLNNPHEWLRRKVRCIALASVPTASLKTLESSGRRSC